MPVSLPNLPRVGIEGLAGLMLGFYAVVWVAKQLVRFLYPDAFRERGRGRRREGESQESYVRRNLEYYESRAKRSDYYARQFDRFQRMNHRGLS
jgi:hypothetical protein